MTTTTTRPNVDRDTVLADALAKMNKYADELVAFAESYDPNASKRFVVETSPTLYLRIDENGKTCSTGILNATLFTKAQALRIVRDGNLRDGTGAPVAATIRNVNAAARESLAELRKTIETFSAL